MEGQEEERVQTKEDPIEPNPEFLKSLMDMGISRDVAEKALRKTKNSSVEMAVAVAMEGGEGSDEEDWSDIEEAYKMVFVVNESLNMSIGKTAAQVAHGAIELYRQLVSDTEHTVDLYAWQEVGEKKVVLKGKDEHHLLDLQQCALSNKVPAVVIRDAGHTEIPPNSLTVLALFGEEKNVDKVTSSLRLL